MWSISRKFKWNGKSAGKTWLAMGLPVTLLLGTGVMLAVADGSNQVVPEFQVFSDPAGAFANLNLGGPTDTSTNPFFQDLGATAGAASRATNPATPFRLRRRISVTALKPPKARTPSFVLWTARIAQWRTSPRQRNVARLTACF